MYIGLDEMPILMVNLFFYGSALFQITQLLTYYYSQDTET